MYTNILLKATLVLSAFASYAYGTTYAQFCNDTNCSDSCGISVSVDNPGCLNESGRQSISFHDTNIQQVSLVFTPGADCNCQNYCINELLTQGIGDIYRGPSCIDISGLPSAQSFRFIGGGCGANNC